MPSSENDDVVQTFASGTANESFTNGIHQRRLDCCAQDVCASPLRNTVEFGAKLAVIVPNDELRSLPEGRDVAELLRCPLPGRCPSDADMNHAFRIDVNQKERKDGPKPDIIGLQEIAGPHCMVLQKCSPVLSAREFRWSGLAHVSLDCALCDSNTKLQEFAADPFRAPQDIFRGHTVDECDDVWVNSGSTAFSILRFPTPEEPKSLTMPTDHRCRFHQQKSIAPMWQKARKQDNQAALMGPENGTFDLSRCDDELLAKHGILQQQLGPRASNIGNETSEHG